MNNPVGNKHRVLLVWFELPNRPELQEPFVNLSDKFEFIHLVFNSPAEREQAHSPFKMIFWFDYPTPYALLNKIKPHVILSEFPSDLKCIALAIAAKEYNIPYLGITHGIYFADSFNVVIPNGNSASKFDRYGKYVKILRFYLSVLKLTDKKLAAHMLQFLYYFMRIGYFEALGKVKFEQRWPLRYLVYQMKNSDEIMYNKHGFPAERLVPIGVPQFDRMFRYWNSFQQNAAEKSKYYLMIDTAWIFNATKPPDETIYGTYTKLANFCREKGCKLIVKLHPHWYEHDALPQDANIEYIRHVSQDKLAELMIKAQGCFLYFSTLSIPIVPYVNCYFLYYKTPSKDLIDIVNLRVAKALDIAEIERTPIDFEAGFSHEHIDVYVDNYLYATDGESTKRLGEILESFSKTSGGLAQV